MRERGDDIALLAERFLQRFLRSGRVKVHFTGAALDELRRRPWPGNVRELRNAVEHAALLARAGAITPEHLPPRIAGQAPPAEAEDDWAGPFATGRSSVWPALACRRISISSFSTKPNRRC